jgi:hypothetical protein
MDNCGCDSPSQDSTANASQDESRIVHQDHDPVPERIIASIQKRVFRQKADSCATYDTQDRADPQQVSPKKYLPQRFFHGHVRLFLLIHTCPPTSFTGWSFCPALFLLFGE